MLFLTDKWITQTLVSKLALEDGMHAQQRLLSSFCECVVTLAPDLRITQAPPGLMHLIDPGNTANPADLEGTLLSCHLVLNIYTLLLRFDGSGGAIFDCQGKCYVL